MDTLFQSCNLAMMARAHDSMIKHKRIFYHRGRFYRVRWLHYGHREICGTRIFLESPRRSIDDCTVADWKAATKD